MQGFFFAENRFIWRYLAVFPELSLLYSTNLPNMYGTAHHNRRAAEDNPPPHRFVWIQPNV